MFMELHGQVEENSFENVVPTCNIFKVQFSVGFVPEVLYLVQSLTIVFLRLVPNILIR